MFMPKTQVDTSLSTLHLSNVNDLRKDISTSFFDQWITNPTLSVTSFFVISATVSSYGWFLKWNVAEEQERRQIYTVKYWLKFYIHRMIRLLPAYFYTLITVTYKSTNHSYSSAWPQTDPYVQCRKHWLEHLLLLNCFGKATCLGWTWYVSAEFFCYLASPIFLITLAINSWIGIAVSIFTIGCSSVYAAFLIFRDNLPPVPLIWSIQYGYDIEYYHHVTSVYIRPEQHISAYVIGLLLGYLLTTLKRESQRNTSLNTRVWLGWLIASSFGFISLFGLYPVIQKLPNVHISSEKFQAYLVHMVHIASVLQGQRFPLVYRGRYQIFAYVSKTVLLSYFFALFAAFIAEYPAMNLERIIFSKKSIPNGRMPNEDTKKLMHYGHKTDLVANDQQNVNEMINRR
ncbi:unnamed protein product [Anisakis simplex]|uniref:Acyl_transf_3 domain-containing protein n=1 Tax=Anisakis simplex TaxID=6269 RepID=A0A0M3JRP2_ANISI|nr:unnamed protein product [Anisakis simplex]